MLYTRLFRASLFEVPYFLAVDALDAVPAFGLEVFSAVFCVDPDVAGGFQLGDGDEFLALDHEVFPSFPCCGVSDSVHAVVSVETVKKTGVLVPTYAPTTLNSKYSTAPV